MSEDAGGARSEDRGRDDAGLRDGEGAEGGDIRLLGDRPVDGGGPADPREAGVPAGGGPGRPPGVGPGRSSASGQSMAPGGPPDAIRSGGPTGNMPLEPAEGAPFEDEAGRPLPSE